MAIDLASAVAWIVQLQLTVRLYIESSTHRLQIGGLLVINVVFVVLTALYARATPPFEAPDAGAHYVYIVYVQQNGVLPTLDERHAAISHQLVQQPPLYYALAAAAMAWLPAERGLELLNPNPHYLLGQTHRATATVNQASREAHLAVWIARGVSMLGGLLALNASFLLVRLLFPGEAWLALAVASVVAFNPRFLFSAATITNDAWAAGTAALAIWLMLRAAREPDRLWGWLWAGGALGMAALAKYGNLAIGAPAALIVLAVWQRVGWRQLLRATVTLAIGAFAIAGFWYVRNWLLWGEIAPLTPMLAVLPDLARDEPLDLSGLFALMPVLQNSFWGEFGYGVLAPPWFFDAMRYAALLAALGAAICMARALRRRSVDLPMAGQTLYALALAVVWSGAVFVSLLNWMRLVNFTAQGRLLYSAITPIALLLVLGWQAFLPRRSQRFLQMAVPPIFCLLALSQLNVLAEAYRIPPTIVGSLQPDRNVHAVFENGAVLIGADFPNGAAIDGKEALPLTLYWTAQRPIDEFYTLFIHLTDSHGGMVYQFDGAPVQGRHPTPQWIPGARFADSYVLHPTSSVADDLATLTVGFYRHDQPTERVALVDNEGAAVADVVTLAQVRLNRETPPCPDAPSMAQWENGIQLLELESDIAVGGDSLILMLRWGASRVIHTNYTVFLQALDSADQIVAQIDRWPQDGAYPTSTWRPGDCIIDAYRFENLPTSWNRVILGLYDERIQRLPVAGGSDFIEIISK